MRSGTSRSGASICSAAGPIDARRRGLGRRAASRVHLEQAAAAMPAPRCNSSRVRRRPAGVTQRLCRSEPARRRSLGGRHRRISLAAQRVLRRRRGYGGDDRCGRRHGPAPRRLHRARDRNSWSAACTPARAISQRTRHAARRAANMLFANNTRDAIERGCRVALAALVDRAFQESGGSRHDATCVVGHRRRDRANRAVHEWPACSRARSGLAWPGDAGAGRT